MSVEDKTKKDGDSVPPSSYPQKKRRGDRKDGWILKDLSPFTKLIPHLMPSRNSSAIYFKEKIDVTDFVRYVEKKMLSYPSPRLKQPRGRWIRSPTSIYF